MEPHQYQILLERIFYREKNIKCRINVQFLFFRIDQFLLLQGEAPYPRPNITQKTYAISSLLPKKTSSAHIAELRGRMAFLLQITLSAS